MYNIKIQDKNIENYKLDIFNYNQRLKLEKANILKFINWAENNSDLIKSLDGHRADKRFIKKLEQTAGELFYIFVDNKYSTLTADFKIYFNNRLTTGRQYQLNHTTKEYEITTAQNNYLEQYQYTKYLTLSKSDQYNDIFNYSNFLLDIEKLKKTVESIDRELKNQTSRLKKAIKLNNDLIDLLYHNDFIKKMFNM